MAKTITNEQKQEMLRLYEELGTYSAVARVMNISASTVSRYIKENKSIKLYTECITAKPIESIPTDQITSFSFLTEEEQQSYQNWLKEFKL